MGSRWLAPWLTHRVTVMVVQIVKNLPARQQTWLWSLAWEDPLEEGIATHSSILAWTEKPGGLQSQTQMRNYIGWLEMWVWGLEEKPGLEIRLSVEIILLKPWEKMRSHRVCSDQEKKSQRFRWAEQKDLGRGLSHIQAENILYHGHILAGRCFPCSARWRLSLDPGARPVTLHGLVWVWGLVCGILIAALYAVVDPCYQLASTLQKYWVITICSPCYPQNSNAPTTFFKLSCLLDFVMHTKFVESPRKSLLSNIGLSFHFRRKCPQHLCVSFLTRN